MAPPLGQRESTSQLMLHSQVRANPGRGRGKWTRWSLVTPTLALGLELEGRERTRDADAHNGHLPCIPDATQ